MRQITKDIEMSIDQQNSLTRFFANGFIDKLELVSCRASVSELLGQQNQNIYSVFPGHYLLIISMASSIVTESTSSSQTSSL